MSEDPSEIGRRDFHGRLTHCVSQASQTMAGTFIAIFAIGENTFDEGEVLAGMKCNVEDPRQFLLHMKDMIEVMLSGVPTTDLRDVKGGMQ